MPASLFVVLATFNGAKYLPEQLASLTAQCRQPDALFVSDDGSSDASLEIIRTWSTSQKFRVEFLPPSPCRLGAAANFGRLLEAALAAGAEFVAPCDQDDWWHPQKLALLETALLPCSEPAIAVCDLTVVDAERRQISASYRDFQCYPMPKCASLSTIAVMNTFPGCAMLLNRQLLVLLLPLPSTALMHDWWSALHAAAVGRIVIVPTALVEYRQHGCNVSGSRGGPLVAAFKHGISLSGNFHGLAGASRQAAAAAERLAGKAPAASLYILQQVAGCAGAGWWKRRRLLLAAHARKLPWSRNLWFYLSC